MKFPEAVESFDGAYDRYSDMLEPFETKTKEDYNWRKSMQTAQMATVSAFDNRCWINSTILETKKVVSGGREVTFAHIAFREYVKP